jgi:hypothetical protein
VKLAPGWESLIYSVNRVVEKMFLFNGHVCPFGVERQ